jgi:hypothetical protein
MMEALYTPEQMRQFAEARAATTEEEIEAIQQGWTELLAEVRAARAAGLDPASAEAQALGERWVELNQWTLRHFPAELQEAIKANYDRGAFEGNMLAPQAEDFAYFERVQAARTSDATSEHE